MLAIHKAHLEQFNTLGGILMLSAWGFAIVIGSFLFLWLGYQLDEKLGTDRTSCWACSSWRSSSAS